MATSNLATCVLGLSYWSKEGMNTKLRILYFCLGFLDIVSPLCHYNMSEVRILFILTMPSPFSLRKLSSESSYSSVPLLPPLAL